VGLVWCGLAPKDSRATGKSEEAGEAGCHKSLSQVKAVRLAPQASFPGTVMSRNDPARADVNGRVSGSPVGTAVAGDIVARLDKNMAQMQRSDKRTSRVLRLSKFDRARRSAWISSWRRRRLKTARERAISTRQQRAALASAKAALRPAIPPLITPTSAAFAGRVVAP
jgi:hypothetical protein